MYDVCKAFYPAEKELKSLMTYFMQFKKIYEELNVLLSFSADIKIQQTQREHMAIMSFLAGLPSKFETAKSQILSGSEIIYFQEVFSRVLAQKLLYLISILMFLLQEKEEEIITGKETEQ